MGNNKNGVVMLLMAAINFTHILDFMIMMPLGNYLIPYFKISPAQFTYLVAAYTISAGISGFLAAFFVDNFDRKKVLLFGYVGFLAGTLVLFAVWFTLSTGRGVAAQAMVSNVIPAATRGSFMSFNSSIQQLGTSAASLVAGLIVAKGANGRILHYNWVGYLSIAVLMTTVIIGLRTFKQTDVVRRVNSA